MTDLAIIAGQGRLPDLLAEAAPDAVRLYLNNHTQTTENNIFRLERIVPTLRALYDRGVRRICFAGGVSRPRLDPEAFDPASAALVPRILAALGQGDDAALGILIEIVEEFDLTVIPAEEIRPDLLPAAGWLAGSPSDEITRDAARAAQILQVTGGLDIGQGCVVRGGLCTAIETLPGTAAMLEFVANHAPGGVLFKSPKPGQDTRIDRPAIGPDTVAEAARAGLSAIVWPAGQVLVLDRDATQAAAQESGIALWAQ